MKLTLVILMSIIFAAGCATVGPLHSGAETLSDMSVVYAKPLETDGKIFEGRVFVFVSSGFYAFLPEDVADSRAFDSYEVSVLPGTGQSLHDLVPALKTGDRIFLRGRIRVDRACFTSTTCTPWSRPVFIDDLSVLKR